jgi:hypothetical protein
MTDNAEMGEQPADPATRWGVGVGAVPDDYADGVAEEQLETSGEAANPAGATREQGDHGQAADPTPTSERGSFADSGAAESGMQSVDDWGTGEQQPLASPGADRES